MIHLSIELIIVVFRIMLDTPMNRKWMPKADTGTWTPLEYIAEYVRKQIFPQEANRFICNLGYSANGLKIHHHVRMVDLWLN